MKISLALFLLFFSVQAFPSSPEIYYGMTEDFPPFNFEEKGKITGFSTEIARHIFKKNQLTVSFKLWPWARSYNAALKKPYHFVYTTSRTPDREKLFKWVGPIAKDEFYIAVPTDSKLKPSANFKDFQSFKISGIAEDQPTVFLEKHGFKFIHTQDDAARGMMLKKGLLEIDVVSSSSHRHYEQIYGLKLRKIAHLYTTDYYLAFHPSTPDEIIAKLNKTLSAFIVSPEYKKLENRFYRLD